MELRRLRPFLLVVIIAAGLFWLRAIRMEMALPPPGARVPPLGPEPPTRTHVVRGRASTRDVTFFAISDTHLGYVPEEVQEKVVASLQGIVGHAYPPAIGGNVATPSGLLITGDLTERGIEPELDRWRHFYGSTATQPSEAGLTVPTYEIVGNHDSRGGLVVADAVAERHGGKPYSFDLGDIHFDAMGEAPDDNALDWMERDLAKIAKDVPLVVYLHLPLDGPWSRGHWFASGDYKDRLAKMLDGRCVVGILHGHHHATDHYIWRGFDVYKPGAVKSTSHTFAVFHVEGDTVGVGYFNYDREEWVWSQKKSLCAIEPEPGP